MPYQLKKRRSRDMDDVSEIGQDLIEGSIDLSIASGLSATIPGTAGLVMRSGTLPTYSMKLLERASGRKKKRK